MATAEQIAAFFEFKESDDHQMVDDQYVIIGREEEFSVQVCDPLDYEENDENFDEMPMVYVVNSYRHEDSSILGMDHGEFSKLADAQRACLKLAGIDPDVDAVPQPSVPGPK